MLATGDILMSVHNYRSITEFYRRCDTTLCCTCSEKEGDARYALDLLRTSGELADEKGTEMVFEEYVREAKDQIEHNKVTDIVMTLPSQQQKVLESLVFLTKRKEEITSGRLYDVYKDITKGDSVSYRRIFDFINELEMLGLISTKTVSRVG
jgi:cell division control protein 6